MNEQLTSDLSDRELEILQLVATGASNKEIAQKLFISPNTVKVHLRNIFEKIGAVSRTEAAMYAVKMGIINTGQTNQEIISPKSLYPQIDITPKGGQELLETGKVEKPAIRIRIWFISLWAIIIIGLGGGIYYLVFGTTSEQNTNLSSPTPSQTGIRWRKLADMPTSRLGMAGAILNNKIYVIGGEASDGITDIVEEYNPETDIWNEMTKKPTAVTDVQAVVIGGKILVPGGRVNKASLTEKVEAYDPINDTWESLPPLSIPLSNYAITSFEGRVFIFGGWDGNEITKIVYEYNPTSHEWIEHSSLSIARMDAGATSAGGNIYLIGGFDGDEILTRNDVFFPQRNPKQESLWESRAPLPNACSISGITVVADNIFVRCNDDASSIYSYSPLNNSWQSIVDPNPVEMPTESILLYLGNYLYFLGGIDSVGTKSNANWSNQIFYTLLLPYLNK